MFEALLLKVLTNTESRKLKGREPKEKFDELKGLGFKITVRALHCGLRELQSMW